MTVPSARPDETSPRHIRRRPTTAQQRVLDAITVLGSDLGHPPSLREVAGVVGVGVSTVHHHVRALETSGWLWRRPNTARTVVAVS